MASVIYKKRMVIYINIMRVLELFSGTGSVGSVCRARGMDVVSLDRDMPADIRCEILDWDFRSFDYPFVVHCSSSMLKPNVCVGRYLKLGEGSP